MLQQQGGSWVEVAKPSIYRGKIEEVSVFINAACLYLSMKITEEIEATKMAWVLSYMQEGVVEAWKNNLLDELLKRESEVEIVEGLFKKMKNEFGKTAEKEKKIKQLRTIEQRERIYNEYVQEFKKIARGSKYKRQLFTEEFKRGLNETIRRKLVKAKSPPAQSRSSRKGW